MTHLQKESQLILDRLRSESREYDRPDVRLATINRLVIACDDLALGRNAETVRMCTEFKGRYDIAISATNIERYVNARRAAGERGWTGPKRTFIASDRTISAYVRARENERRKPETAKRPTERYKVLEEAIGSIREPEKQQLLRHELEDGRAAKRRLALILNGLRAMPGVDINLILAPTASSASQAPAKAEMPIGVAEISPADRELLVDLITRLLDAAEMKRAGLELDGKRLRMAIAPRTTIIRPLEMNVLQRLARRAVDGQLSSSD